MNEDTDFGGITAAPLDVHFAPGQAGIPPDKVVLLNGYDQGYPDDGLILPVDRFAGTIIRDRLPGAKPRFAAEGMMQFRGGTWWVDMPGAPGNMLFPRQAPLLNANLDPGAQYHVGGVVDTTVAPPVMDIQMIEAMPQSRRRKWIFEDVIERR